MVANMILFLLILLSVFLENIHSVRNKKNNCEAILGPTLIKEIASYSSSSDAILNYVLSGEFKGRTYKELSEFIDKFGTRPSGTWNLEKSIDYLIDLTKKENLHNITTEKLTVPLWERGNEELTMLQPRHKDIALIGLGNSVPTPKDGIIAEVLVADSFSEFDKIAHEDVEGKIVLFNAIFKDYFETVIYRHQAAWRAAAKGAVASLVRSITPFSINSPHTGLQAYKENITKIPTAAITLEDSNLLRRLYDRGQKVILRLKMSSNLSTNISRNTLVDYYGCGKSEQQVIVSGHVDSWDNGEGAMDDGGGLFISWAVPVVLKNLNMQPRRTIRSIFWTAEEQGYIGAYAYEEKHRNELDRIQFIMESDEGTFTPLGLKVAGSKKAKCIIAEILKLFKEINATTLIEDETPGSDINVIIRKGVPGASLLNDNDKYWWFHHSEGDRMDVEDERDLDLCTAFWTAAAYIIADISADIPR